VYIYVQVVKLKGSKRSVQGWCHYLTIISRLVMSSQTDEGRVESVILGIDIRDTPAADAATVGLILPITSSMSVRICGQ